MTKIKRYLPCLAALGAFCLGTAALRGEELSLDQVLNRMDTAGSKLHSMRAEIHQKKWTAILEEFDQGESGSFSFLKTDKGLYLRKDIDDPTSNTLVIKEGQVTFFQPSIKQAQCYDLGSHGDKAEFLLLGFASNKKAPLGETYQTSLLGTEAVGEHRTFKLELRPKSENVAAFFVRIVLWVDDQIWVPVQQQLVEPTDDYLLIRFSEIELDAKLSKSDFNVALPKDVKIIKN